MRFDKASDRLIQFWMNDKNIYAMNEYIKSCHQEIDRFRSEEFVPYSTNENGYPHMAIDQYGRGKILLINPEDGTCLIPNMD